MLLNVVQLNHVSRDMNNCDTRQKHLWMALLLVEHKLSMPFD